MRGRWASAAIGAGVARSRAGREMEAQDAVSPARNGSIKGRASKRDGTNETTTHNKVNQNNHLVRKM